MKSIALLAGILSAFVLCSAVFAIHAGIPPWTSAVTTSDTTRLVGPIKGPRLFFRVQSIIATITVRPPHGLESKLCYFRPLPMSFANHLERNKLLLGNYS